MRLKWLKDDGTNPQLTRYYAVNPTKEPGEGQPTDSSEREPADIIKALSLRPDVAYHIMSAAKLGHFDTTGYLTQDTKQMIATYTSALRSCVF